MGSIHRQPGKPNWVASFRVYDEQTNRWKQVLRSTFTRSKRQAQKICDAWDEAAKAAHDGTLSVDAAREVIARGVANIFATSNHAAMPSASIKAWCSSWLQSKAIEAEQSTHARYKSIVERFIAFLGAAKCSANLATLQASDIAQFRDREAQERAPSTANLALRVLRNCLSEAVRQQVLPVNPASHVKMFKSTSESKRRPFTLSEIKRILAACDVEWRGIVLFGLYLGQRLGDLVRLTWRSVNFETNEIAFTAKKTGRRVVLPLMQPLIDYLSELNASDNPNAHIFPNAAKVKYVATLSNQFHDILEDAGLAESRKYRRSSSDKSDGRARRSSEISFHSLRHSAVTMLKASGLSDVFAREIVGHESAAVSRHYTHLSTDDLRNAMQRLPDVTRSL
jgi:integrase